MIPMISQDAGRLVLFFFFQAEDGIRDLTVTGVQTCALPILPLAQTITGVLGVSNGDSAFVTARTACAGTTRRMASARAASARSATTATRSQIGRASCRERV